MFDVVCMWLLIVPGSDLNPNILSLATRSDASGRSADLTVGHGATSSMRSQSWMNTLSNASSTSKKSSGGPASLWLYVRYLLLRLMLVLTIAILMWSGYVCCSFTCRK